MADEHVSAKAFIVGGGSRTFVVGGVEFSDASAIPHGMRRLRHRLEKGELADDLRFAKALQVVFDDGLGYLHSAAKAAAETGASKVPAPLLARLSFGVPSAAELRRAAAHLDVDVSELALDADQHPINDLARPLRIYELVCVRIGASL